MTATPTKIDVAVRVRPLLDNERMHGLRQNRLRVYPSSHEVKLLDSEGKSTKSFNFDMVCGDNCSQEEFYQTVGIEKFIDRVLEGYHATVFVYGQTGAGKTFTMEGLEYDISNSRTVHRKQNKILGMKDAGIIPRAIKDLFDKIPEISKKYNRNYNVYCSFLELYNEKIYDLLNPDQLSRLSLTSPGLKLRWHKKDQFVVENLYVFACSNAEELEFLFQMGVKNKTMASHRLNNASSRSHCIFEIKVEFSDAQYPDDVIVSKLALVDLAGSERAAFVGSDGRLAKEAIEINKSLFTLRQVINAIFENQNKGVKTDYHIPFRESKLTSLLKQSIGGNSYCLMIACLSPSDESFEENLSTLGYATKVTTIQNEPVRNEDPRWGVIQNLKFENVDLIQKLNDANKQILFLTQNIHKYGKAPNQGQAGVQGVYQNSKNGSIDNIEHQGDERLSQGQFSAGLSNFSPADPNLKIPYVTNKQPYSLPPAEANSEDFMFSENLTQQLVVAINQIRDLLEVLKKERERNEALTLKVDHHENTIVTLMRENQELRDQIILLESSGGGGGHNSRQTRASSGSAQRPGTYQRGATNAFGNFPPPIDKERFKPSLAGYDSSYKHVMPKIVNQTRVEAHDGKKSPNLNQVGASIVVGGNPETVYAENHYRTTTMFARNAMYRKTNTAGKGLSDTLTEFHQSFNDKNQMGLDYGSRTQISPGKESENLFEEGTEERKGAYDYQRKQMVVSTEPKKERQATPLGRKGTPTRERDINNMTTWQRPPTNETIKESIRKADKSFDL